MLGARTVIRWLPRRWSEFRRYPWTNYRRVAGGLDGNQGTHHFLQHVRACLSDGGSRDCGSKGGGRSRAITFPGGGNCAGHDAGKIGGESGARGIRTCSGGYHGLACRAARDHFWDADAIWEYVRADEEFTRSNGRVMG